MVQDKITPEHILNLGDLLVHKKRQEHDFFSSSYTHKIKILNT